MATEALRLRKALEDIDRRTEDVAQQVDATRSIATAVGKVTSVVFVAHLGPLTDYGSAAALEKACGLNLKIRSSGNYVGRLAITKRGSPVVRHYLYLAALRLIRNDPRITAWFRSRAGYRGGNKLVAVVAVMRKLIRALWYVARGNDFDSSKLIDERAPAARSKLQHRPPRRLRMTHQLHLSCERHALTLSASLRTLSRARCSRVRDSHVSSAAQAFA